MVSIELSPSLRCADTVPIRGLIARPGEALGIDEGLKENGFIAIPYPPVGYDSFRRQGKDAGGEVPYLHEDEEPGVIDDEVEVFLSRCRVPADIVVPGGALPCGCGKTQQGKDLAVRFDHVPELRTR